MTIFGVFKGSDRYLNNRRSNLDIKNNIFERETRGSGRKTVDSLVKTCQEAQHKSSNDIGRFAKEIAFRSGKGGKKPSAPLIVKHDKKVQIRPSLQGPHKQFVSDLELKMKSTSIKESSELPNDEKNTGDREKFLRLRARFRQQNQMASIQAEIDWKQKGPGMNGTV